jgi:hypothetical protein
VCNVAGHGIGAADRRRSDAGHSKAIVLKGAPKSVRVETPRTDSGSGMRLSIDELMRLAPRAVGNGRPKSEPPSRAVL